eukprot:5664697-Prymnesium_polylepis.1
MYGEPAQRGWLHGPGRTRSEMQVAARPRDTGHRAAAPAPARPLSLTTEHTVECRVSHHKWGGRVIRWK